MDIGRSSTIMKKIACLIIWVLIACGSHLIAGPGYQHDETDSNVPELMEFHKVIYPIWHNAYPKKDYAALRDYVDKINSLFKKVAAAKLPGILRDKKAEWQEGLEALKKTVEDYNKAAAGDDDAALLLAAEELHSKFEMMVRIIRPVLKEVDEFHRVLYVVYHKHLPSKDFTQIKALSGELKIKAEAITKAELPKRLAAKTDAFNQAAQELYAAAIALEKACGVGDGAAVEAAVDHLHTRYQKLEGVF